MSNDDIAGKLCNALDDFFAQYSHLLKQDCYAVAVSGGPDSMALVGALYRRCVQADKLLHVITVDHGLREGAKQEAQQVGELSLIHI